MRILYAVVLQKNNVYLKENLQVDPVLDALYEKRIFTQADCDRCRQAAPERRCELFLEILKTKGVEGYTALCAPLDTSQPFVKAQLDATAAEEDDEDLVYVNFDIMEDRYKKEFAEKDEEIADLRSSVQRLEDQIQQKFQDHADLEETIKKEREEHRSQIQKQNEETEALKMQLSNLSKDLQQSRARCETLEKSVQRLEDQIQQKSQDHADLEETIKKERGEHRSQIEKQNEETEALKMQLSNLNKDLQHSHAKYETLEKRLQEEQEAYDALVGAPRSQSPDRVDNTEQVKHAVEMGSGEGLCQFPTQSCCDESQLRLLPCLHSACKPCLDHQATQAEENCIQCPSCGRDFTKEQTTVDHVRRNEAVYKVNADGEMKCSYIEGDHDAIAVVYCHECDDKLCSDCHKLHDTPKRNQNHRVSGIDQSTNVPMKQWLKERNCRDHPDNKLQLYDHTCKKAVCVICVYGAHNDHQNEDLYQAYDVAKGQLEEQVKKQQLKLQDVTGRIKTVTSHQTDLATTQRRLEQVATKACKGVAARFLHRQRQLMEEIQLSLQSPYKMIQEKFDTLHDVHISIVSAIDYTQRTLESTRREELITLTDVLQTKCDDNLQMKLPEDDTRATKILLTFQGQRALEELINTFGGLASSLNMDHIPDSQPTSQDLMTMTLRERQANERLQEQKSLDQADLKETIKKEREEHRSQTEKQNEEAEALKMQLSKLNKDLHSQAKCEEIEKMHEGRWQQLQQMIRRVPGLKGSAIRNARSQEPEPLTSEQAYGIVANLIIGGFIHGETVPRGITLKGYVTLHKIREDRSAKFIICPKLQLDAGRANTDYCRVTTDGEMVNSQPTTQHTDSGRLQTLYGTCSYTPIPLPPPPSSVTPVPYTTRYWEAHTRVGVVGEGRRWPVLEVGVGEESQVDSRRNVCNQLRSWCVSVWSSDTHRGSICTRVFLAGERGKCYSNTMSNTPGTQATLHYGVVLDVGRGRIGFIDVDRSAVLGKVDVKFKEDLLPVFGVYRFNDYTVNMKVVSGEEILMSDIKKSLINKVLT